MYERFILRYVLVGSLFLVSCSSVQMIKQANAKSKSLKYMKKVKDGELLDLAENDAEFADQSYQQVEAEAVEELTQKAKGPEGLFLPEYKVIDASKFEIDYSDRLFRFWVHFFTQRDKERFTRHLENGDQYYTTVAAILKEEGLPEDIFFVGLIESGYNTRIKSRAAAVGPWQFIKGTGKRYGLKINAQLDERRNIHKATRAAANYLKDLYEIFGSWELALCAYNSGENRVINAIKKGQTMDYLSLVNMKLLPKETIHYVPKMAAARYLYQNSVKYGFGVRKKPTTLYAKSDLVKLNKSFDLPKLSKSLGVPQEHMEMLNPDLNQRRLKVHGRPHYLVVPEHHHDQIKNVDYEIADVAEARPIAVVTKRPKTYKVKPGDKLAKIAKRFGVSVADLRALNKLKANAKLRSGQRLRLEKLARVRIYTVRRGDSLKRIAKRFGTSIPHLLTLNDLDDRTIYPRQKLKVPL